MSRLVRGRGWLIGLGALAALGLGGCPPAVAPKAGGAGPRAEDDRRDLFSISGMTQAILELDATRGSPAAKPLQAEYERQYRASPKDPFKRFLWAYALDDRNEGWQEMSKVTKLNDRFYWVYVGMGVILDEWKVYDQSEAQFERALKLGPDIALGLARYGRMRLHQGDGDRAVALLATAVARQPEEVSFRLDLARAQALAGKLEDARAGYLEVLARRPELFAAHEELGALLARLGDRAAAVESYGRAAALAPGSFPVRWTRANLLAELERLPEAIEAAREACALQAEDLACWRRLVELGQRAGSREVVVFAYEQIVRAEAGNLEANAFLAPIYLAAGEIERAQPAFVAVLHERPDDPEALLGLAQIYEQGEEFSRAIEVALRVLEVAPDRTAARDMLGRIFPRFHITPEPIQDSTPDKVFATNQRKLSEAYKLRLKAVPGLAGDMLLKVSVDNDGQVVAVRMSKNEVNDPILDMCALWNLRRSRFPTGYGATYDFEISLRPGGK
ncbi:MAG TPA: tetratricopeptide repeat protein [Myxococcota bacterium]|nr:tetratricopeptide repeat protein [Myxococcota bacterium]HRY92585.1 tetratricopeptide repeat protein [Myxococcota bacterium]HSA23513.1 tetratricopeptide repeat protein [Myxococcota bacterium]